MSITEALFDLQAFHLCPLQKDPFDFLLVPSLIRAEALQAIRTDYPRLPGPGTWPLGDVEAGEGFNRLWQAVNEPEFRQLIEQKFAMDLSDTVMMGTVRDQCQQSDGNIHTDSSSKLITILFYFNESWSHDGARLRLLRSPTNLEDYAYEVAPEKGNMLAFRVCDHSWHGHKPYAGERRIVQIHFAKPKRVKQNAIKRQTSWAWRFKKAFGLG